MATPPTQSTARDSAASVAATAEQKLAAAFSLRATAWELAAAGVRFRHPDLAEDAVQARVRDAFMRAVD